MKRLQIPTLALCILAMRAAVHAQSFSWLGPPSNANGGAFLSIPVVSGNTVFCVATAGGPPVGDPTQGSGFVFAVQTDGTGFRVLHAFGGISPDNSKNADGATPSSVLLLGNMLYGTTYAGGSNGSGTLFAVTTNGTGFTTPYSFISGQGGFRPSVVLGGTLYGTTGVGGEYGLGSLAAINTDGTDFRTLYSFRGGSDGVDPGKLILSGNVFYGAAAEAVFMVATNGTNFTTLHTLDSATEGYRWGELYAGLALAGSTLYGTAQQDGPNGTGTIWAVTTNGTAFNILHSFSARSYDPASGAFTNSEGTMPWGLTVSGSTLYGTCYDGGSSGLGTIFAVNTNGTGFTTLYNFTTFTSPNNPGADPVLSGDTLYGTTPDGLYALSLPGGLAPAPLTIYSAGNAVVLNWSNSSLVLQSAPYVGGTFTNVPAAASPYTNVITGTQWFFRLHSN